MALALPTIPPGVLKMLQVEAEVPLPMLVLARLWVLPSPVEVQVRVQEVRLLQVLREAVVQGQ